METLEKKDFLNRFEKAELGAAQPRMKRLLLRPFATLVRYIGVGILERLKIYLPLKARLFWGEKMKVYFPEYVSTGLIYDHFTEPDVTRFVIDRMGKGMTFVDVGAHFGYFSILAAACGGSGCRVVAFEPTPSTYAVLKENTSSSDSILALNMGLYSSEGRLPFKDFGIGHGAFNTLYRGTKPVTELFATKAREIVVPVTTLDAYCKASACKPDVIKLDAETAEYEILQGARETIGKYHPDISIEAGGGAGDVGSSRQAVHYLLSVGYQQYIWEGGRLVRVRATSDDFSSVANLFFIHPSRQIATGA